MYSFARFQQNFDKQRALQKLIEGNPDASIEEVLDMNECVDELRSANKTVEA